MKRFVLLFLALVALALGYAGGGMGDSCSRPRIEVYQGDNLPLMKKMPSESVDLIYIDPPFNTGRRQERKRKDGESFGYDDSFEDLQQFLRPRMIEAYRIPYMAPELVGPEKAAVGKTPTDVWWHTIVSPSGKEKAGYATQKPRGIIDRIVKVHSRKGDVCFDFLAGSGTLGESAYMNGRSAILIDRNPDAINVMRKRFADFDARWHASEEVGL